MKEKAFNQGIVTIVDTNNPKNRNMESIRKLFHENLNNLGVPFTDECCPDASTATATGNAPISITYSQLITSIGANELVLGQQYLLTDYATTHYIVDIDGVQYLDTIITGVNEPLIVTANSTNTLDKEARSALHPEDVIYYDWNPDNWIEDLSFADLSGTPTIVTGFKGVIYFRHDTLLDNSMGYDFRNCKFRRWKTDCTVWDDTTTFAKGDFVNHAGYIYRSLIDSNLNNTPPSGSSYWVELLDLALTEYWNNTPNSANNIPSDSLEFDDFKTFSEGSGSATYERCCRSNHFIPFKDDDYNYIISGTLLMNNVFFLQDEDEFTVYSNSFGAECFGNTIANDFYTNTIANNFKSNTIANNFYTNTIANSFRGNIINSSQNNTIGGNFQSNTIGSYFQNNTIANNFYNNTIGGNFYNNTIGGNFQSNTIANNFKSNTIANNFYTNTIANNFYTNTIANNFRGNIIGDNFIRNQANDFASDGINYTSATHVYAAYNTTIFLNATPAARLSYYTAGNVLTIVNPNT